jgi:methylmalonyl-CoA/ethylmalonyl-CoA epimerase
MREESPFSKVDQIGVVVRNIEGAIKYYEALGIGPFIPFRNTDVVERQMWGKPVSPNSIKSVIELTKIGTLELELIEPVEGNSIWSEFLTTHGEGVQHLGFFVDDINKEEAKMVRKGFTVVYRSRFSNGDGAAYFQTDAGGFLLELIQRAPEYR